MKKFIFVACILFAMCFSAFGQDNLTRDLNRSLKNFELVNVDKEAIREKAETRQPIGIRAYGRDFTFVLVPNDLRGANYKAVETTDLGDSELSRGEVNTFKGKLWGDPKSEVRFTVSENEIEGLIYTGEGTKFFLVEAEKFSDHARQNEAVVYKEEDLLKTVDLTNDTGVIPDEIEGKIETGLDITKTFIESAAAAVAPEAGFRAVEVATEADYQWVTQAGGAAAANNEILGILNLVDGIYKRDLNLTVVVTFQHVWSTADPFSSASTSAELDSFLSYWNSNYPRSQYPRDTAHLFTGKFGNQGIAYQGVICRSSNYAYGITARSGSVNHLIAAHEIGHNLGAEHVANSGTCTTSLMNPSLTYGATAFCDVSKSQVSGFVASYGSCLTETGGTTPTPTPTPTLTPTPTPTPTPSCTYSITPLSQNFGSTGGTGSVYVTTQNGCGWTAASNQFFVSILSGGSGFGSGTVTYSVAQNMSPSSRSAAIVIAGRSHAIFQSGAVATNPRSPRFDFDGDGKADIAVFRPSTGAWYILNSSTNSYYGYTFGISTDLIAPADFDGDRKTDIAVFRPSNGYWYYLRSSTGQLASVQFGQIGDKPVPGDFDADGRADVSLYRPSNGTWYRLNSSNGQSVSAQFGQTGDIPLIGDFDGDAKSDLAVFRASNGTWNIQRSSNLSTYTISFGQTGDIPTAEDFDGDGRTDIALFRAATGNWYLLNNSSGTSSNLQFGVTGDKPVAADFDGDGKADIAVYRTSTGSWYLQRSSSGFTGIRFGSSSDIPIPASFLQ